MDRLHAQKIWKIASDLGLPPNGAPADAILGFCEDRAKAMLFDFPECASPSELLDIMAATLGTRFEEVQSDDELFALQRQYVLSGELGFTSLGKELEGESYGVTFLRMVACTGERPFVSVIDCRGKKSLRSYFTKWHEIAHLLILTDQQKSAYKRTHGYGANKDPEETLVDLIAGHMGFLPTFLLPEIRADVSFSEVDRIRLKLCPEASFQASAIAYAKNHRLPCLLIEAKLALRKDEEAETFQGCFSFHDPPTPRLRVQMVVPGGDARKHGLYIPKNHRVPETSVIHQVHDGQQDYAVATECLSFWKSSDGKRLEALPVRIEARKSFDAVLALISLAGDGPHLQRGTQKKRNPGGTRIFDDSY
ncbi:MAG: hypothetical protein LLG20_27855 [Acidobacteriales bacterium]|nr:hypothetical protein [Terriglobales bacterium]